MFDLHAKLCEFESDYVRLGTDEKTKLANYRDINLDRLKDGFDKIGEKDNTHHNMPKESCNQGSYAMNTLNQHPDNDYDIDVALIFRKDDLPDDAAAAREFIARAFCEVGGNFNKDPEARRNAVTVWYADGYHIDFAIYRSSVDAFGTEKIEHAGSDGWTVRDPMETTNWFNKKVKDLSPPQLLGATTEADQMRRIVRLVKVFCRSRASWSLPGGMIISTLVAECYASDYSRDDVSLFKTMKAIRDRLLVNTEVKNPVYTDRFLTGKEKYKTQVTRLKEKLDWALSKLEVLEKSDCTESQALTAWNWVFAHSFWGDAIAEEMQERAEKSLTEGNLKLNAQIAMYKQGPTKGFYPSGSRALPKNIWLRFAIAQTSISQPYQVRWIVQNFGDEAREANDMGHVSTSAANVNWERTAFKGQHKMICELHRDGKVVARASHLVKIKR